MEEVIDIIKILIEVGEILVELEINLIVEIEVVETDHRPYSLQNFGKRGMLEDKVLIGIMIGVKD